MNHQPYSSSVARNLFSPVLVPGAIGILVFLILVLLASASFSFVWKIVLAIVAIAAAIYAAMQWVTSQKALADLQQQVLQGQTNQQSIQSCKALLENYQHLLKDLLPVWQRQ